jgi:signal transduction histidine kinase
MEGAAPRTTTGAATVREPAPGPAAVGRRRPRIETGVALRFLLDAGQALANTLEYEQTLQTLADLAVPRVACFCVVDVVDVSEPGGRERRVAMAHVDRSQLDALGRTTAFMPAAAAAAAEPLLVSPITDEWLNSVASDDAHLALLRRLAPTSLITAPLAARGNPLGVLVLASTRTNRYYGADDLALARELSRIAAVAIDNARLYRQAQDALRARDQILRVVAHDLRSPISAVISGVDLLLEDGPADLRDGPLGRSLRLVRSSAEHAARMIEDLLDLSRMESGRLSLDTAFIPAAPLLREAIATHRRTAEARGITLRGEASDALPRVAADEGRVFQVLGNLLGNALKFTPRGGRVDVGAAADGAEVRWWVADTGPGIAPDDLPHLFDAFWQARRGDRRGLGLGLAIVKGIVEAHGGRAWAESTLGEGTRVTFTLPSAPPSASRAGVSLGREPSTDRD